MKIAYVHLENGVSVTSIRTRPPKDLICECPKDSKGNWVTDLSMLDVVDGVANINTTKQAAKDAAYTLKIVKEDADKQKVLDRKTRLKTAYNNFDTLDAKGKDVLLKDLLEDMLGIK